MSRVAGAALLLATALPACSFLFVEGPAPDRDVRLPPRCTTSGGWPIMDAIFGGLSGAAAMTLILDSEKYGDTPEYKTAVVSNVAGFVIHSLAGAYGDSQVKACRKAVKDWEAAQLAPAAAVPEPAPTLYCYKPGGSTKVICFDTLEQCREGWNALRRSAGAVQAGMRPCRPR